MTNSEKILVINKAITNKLKIKGSQFIGYAYPIDSAIEAINKLNELKREFYDATHHCYAYKTNEGEEKYSDDGEPNGTAGIRIFNAINHFSLTNVLIVVIRYFGGTKLGVGPLGKAYGETAISLLHEAELIELTKFEKISILYNFDDVNSIHFLLNKFKCRNITNNFNISAIIECYIEPKFLNEIDTLLIEKTSGKARLEPLNKDIYLRLK